jgi:RNA polymerase sigma factor (sigma-70 family)
MGNPRGGPGLKSWRTLLEAGSVAGLTDGVLLERFATRRDDAAEAAFAALVARHGPMVRRVCGTVLGDPNDAEDASQATFLVLARKAGAIRSPERLSNWLYGTAYRTSRKLKVQSALRRRHESAAARDEAGPVHDPGRREASETILEEVARLPGECRAVVVLCEFEGLTRAEAASRLGCSDRTLRRHWDRARRILQDRLSRRGVAPASGAIAWALAPDPARAASEASAEAIALAAKRFAARGSVAGAVPAPLSAVILAEGVLRAMLWTKLKGIAVAAGILVVIGAGIGLGVGLASSSGDDRGGEPAPKRAKAVAAGPQPSPEEQYRALVKRHEDAVKAYQKVAEGLTRLEEASEAYLRSGAMPGDHAPGFVALAERYPDDPAAVDALIWVVQQTQSAIDMYPGPFGQAAARAMEILARDHKGEPRLGPLCLKLVHYPSPRRDVFLKAISEGSPDRRVKGQATLALAQYLKLKAEIAKQLQQPNSPMDNEQVRSMYGPDYLKALKESDPAAILKDSERLSDRILADFGDVPYARPDEQPTRETLADVARQVPDLGPGKSSRDRFQALADALRDAEKKADEVFEKVGRNEAGLKAYIESAPKWADYGPKMWAFVEESPRGPEALDALLWILRRHMPFFDAREERSEMVKKAVDLLIRDHLDYLGGHLDARNVSEGFNHGSPMPAPHIDRLYRALHERGRTREARGRAGILLARHLKGEADLIQSFSLRGPDPERRPEVAMWAPSYLEWLLKEGRRDELRRESEAIFEKLEADYGDVKALNGMIVSDETLATFAGRELSEMRSLAVGQAAPEIRGEDVDGKPMTLSEFRGKVILLDFGSHEHCGGCRLVYPRLREIVDQFRGRPLVVLGVNNHDRRETLKQLAARGEVTWRCWLDSDQPGAPGPITTRWNVRGYPTFLVLDHRGVIRSRDLYPEDRRAFDEAIEALVLQAEKDGARD